MAENVVYPADSVDDYWHTAVQVLTGYIMPKRETLFGSLLGNDSIPLMRVEFSDHDGEPSNAVVDAVDDLEWRSDNSGWRVENTDFVVPFYSGMGGSVAEAGVNTKVKMKKARITLLGTSGTDDAPAGGVVLGAEFKSGFGKDFQGQSKDTVWSNKALAQYSYGGGKALEQLLYNGSTLHFSWNDLPVHDVDAVDLESLTLNAQAFDRVAQFFAARSRELKDWEFDLGKQEASWKGQAAGVFKDLIHGLVRTYESYSEQFPVSGTVHSTYGNDLRGFRTDVQNAAQKLHGKWDTWQLLTGNPLRWLHDVLLDVTDHVWHHNITKVRYKPTYSGRGYTTGGYHYVKYEGFSGAVSPYGKLEEKDTWKKIGEEAIRRWQRCVQDVLSAAGKQALIDVENSFNDQKFPEKVNTVSINLANELAKDQAARDRAEAAKAKADAEEKARLAREEAERKAAEAEEKARLAREEAERKAAEAEKLALQRQLEAEARAERRQAEAEARAARKQAEAEAKQAEKEREAEAKQAEAERKQAEKEAEQEAKQAETEAEQEKKEAEQEKKQAEAERRAEEKQAEQEAKQEKKEREAQDRQTLLMNQARTDREQQRKEQEAKQAEAERKQAEKEAEQEARQERLQAEQEQKEHEAEAEQEQKEAEQEKKQAEAEAEQEKKEAEQEKKQAEAEQKRIQTESEYRDRQEEQQAEAEAEQEKKEAEQEARQERLQAEQEQKEHEAEAKQEKREAEQEKKQAEAEKRAERQMRDLGSGAGPLGSGAPDAPVPDGLRLPEGSGHGAGYGTTTLNSDGSVTMDYPDGSSRTIDLPGGDVVTTLPDGSTVTDSLRPGDSITNTDGSVTRLGEDGSLTTTLPDGSRSVLDPDESTLTNNRSDGTRTTSPIDPGQTLPTGLGGGAPGGAGLPDGGSLYSPGYSGAGYEEELYDQVLDSGSGGGDHGLGSGNGAGAGMPMLPMGTRINGASTGGAEGERVRGVADDGQPVTTRRAQSGRGQEEVSVAGRGSLATASGGMPFMPPAGGGAGQQTESGDRERSSWLDEDEDVWGTDEDGAPAVIGR
ncbi:AAWKG family protein [Streptomyces sp. NBC_00654]|uniref:AAWKG family protein n=1 Tax=Streptomyces sp. NBC_00654 TaxID=2975799 RepID=UPI00225BF35B|nr:AAWKG family protein [Streptomyces sp. NBC_00654]MCX4966942.1 AAWKG family protein [Streptomyces sp. NBC_00654]